MTDKNKDRKDGVVPCTPRNSTKALKNLDNFVVVNGKVVNNASGKADDESAGASDEGMSVKSDDAPGALTTVGEGRLLPAAAIRRLLHKLPRGRGFKAGVSEMRTRIWVNLTGLSSPSGGALSASVVITVGDFPEVKTGWSALYDEVKVHGGEVHWNSQATALSGVPPGGIAICYDPADTTAPAALADVLEHSQMQLNAHLTNNTVPFAHTKSGFWIFKFKVPPVTGIEIVGKNAPGMWHDMLPTTGSGTNDGAFKIYGENSGSNVISAQCILALDVSFRSRT